MKSEKAKVYIEDKFISEYNDIEHYLVHFGEDGIVLEKGRIGRCRRYADKAIELAEQEAEERLTRWNDPKERPELYTNVQVKYNTPPGTIGITTAWLGINCLNEWLWTIAGTADLIDDSIVIGWREIHE